MWILIPIFFTLVYFSPFLAAVIWGLVVTVRRRTRLTRRRTITGVPAVLLGLIAIALGITWVVFLVYWAIVNYPRGW